uniref:Nucleoside diphosphate kinase-like domain-containing protein n=1 Tax=Corvus moneduloides TaxID=1196302 RepID=A0A8C3D8E6_CORMO
MQLTLALLKPDAAAHPLVHEAVHAAILRHRFLIVRAKELRCGPEQSRRFYREHADSPASASREIAFFFPEFDEQRWYEQDEPRLRRGQLYYSAEERVHRVLRAEEAEVT